MPAQGTLILVCGLPGSGKTTFAKRLEVERGAIRMCPDDWIEAILERPDDIRERDRLRDPMENLQWDLAKEYLGKGLTVILENGFWAEGERSQYAMEALEFGARIELYYMEALDPEQLWNRVRHRNEALVNKTFTMTRSEHDAAWAVFEAPSCDEIAFYDDGDLIPWAD